MIKVDISIEIYIDINDDRPAFIWVWECKDYSGIINVDEVEQFCNNLDQIAPNNSKGTIVCTKGCFSKTAIEYAKNKGIGLARIMPDDQIVSQLNAINPISGIVLLPFYIYEIFLILFQKAKWKEMKNRELMEHVEKAICTDDYESNEIRFYGITSNNIPYTSFSSFWIEEAQAIFNRAQGSHIDNDYINNIIYLKDYKQIDGIPYESGDWIVCPYCKHRQLLAGLKVDCITKRIYCDICGSLIPKN